MEIELREKPRGFSIYKRVQFQRDMSKELNKYLFNIGLCVFNNKEEPEIINTHIICTREQANDYLNCLIDKCIDEYSCAATPQIRQTGNRLSGLAETAYASLLAQCFV